MEENQDKWHLVHSDLFPLALSCRYSWLHWPESFL